MTEKLREKCELFAANRTAVSKKFVFEKDIMSIAAGLIFTGAGKEADVEKLAECKKILKKHTGFFSEYRESVELALLSEMALSESPEQYIDDVKEVYRKLHKGKIRDNSYMVLAAMLICDLGKQDNADEIIEKYKDIMNRMEKEHPVLTNSEDISYVILLALSDRNSDDIISDINESFDYLKNICKVRAGSDSIQGLSEILALTDGDIREKCDKVIGIYNVLKENKADITGGGAFSSLGTLIGIDEVPETIAGEIMEADAFLKKCRGFEGKDEKSVSTNQRMMFAVMLVAESFGMSTAVLSNSFINYALGVIKAQQIVAVITVISNVLPAILGALGDSDSKDTDNNETPDSEQETNEN